MGAITLERVKIALPTHTPPVGEFIAKHIVFPVLPVPETLNGLAVLAHPRARVLPVPRANTVIMEYALHVRTAEVVII